MKSVYVMKSGSQYKIGVSQEPEKRLHDLAIGNCVIELIYKSDLLSNAYFVENQLHKMFHFAAAGREWFANIDEKFLLEAVKSAVDKYGNRQCKNGKPKNKDYVADSGKIISLNEWIEIQEKETKQIMVENGATLELISTVAQYPKIKNIVMGLLGLGWNCLDINDFIYREIVVK